MTGSALSCIISVTTPRFAMQTGGQGNQQGLRYQSGSKPMADQVRFAAKPETDTTQLLDSIPYCPKSYRDAGQVVSQLQEAYWDGGLRQALLMRILALPQHHLPGSVKRVFQDDLKEGGNRYDSPYRLAAARLLPVLPLPLRIAYIATYHDKALLPFKTDIKLAVLEAVVGIGRDEYGEETPSTGHYRYRYALLKRFAQNFDPTVRAKAKQALRKLWWTDPLF